MQSFFLFFCKREDAAVIQQVAEELREISAQLEHRVVAEATRNLRKNLLASTFDASLTCSSQFCRTFNNTTVVLLGFKQHPVTIAKPTIIFCLIVFCWFFLSFYCRSGSTTSPVRCPRSWGRTWLWRMYHRSTSLWPSPSLWWRECVSRRRGCWGISSEPLCITSFTPGPGDSVKLGESQTVPKGLVLSTRVENFRERTSTFA